MIQKKKDGRTIKTGIDYTKLRTDLFFLQDGRCFACQRSTSLHVDILSDYSFHVAHRGSRGFGSAFRDDVVGPKKGQIKGGMCGKCHRQSHGQQ